MKYSRFLGKEKVAWWEIMCVENVVPTLLMQGHRFARSVESRFLMNG